MGDRYPALSEQTIQQPLSSLRCLEYTSVHDYHLDPKFLEGACHELTTLKLHGVHFASTQAMPIFSALRDLDIGLVTVSNDLGPLFAIIQSAPLLESLFVNDDVVEEPVNYISNGMNALLHLPILRTLHVRCNVSFVHAFLHRIPDPADHFKIDLGTHSDDRFPTEESSQRYEEVYDSVSAFWMRKNSERHLPLGRFIFTRPIVPHSHGDTFRIPRVQFGGTHIEVYFRSDANIDLSHSYWPHVETLHLQDPASTEVLLSDNISSIDRISALIIEIERPKSRDIKILRQCIFKFKSSDSFLVLSTVTHSEAVSSQDGS
jgi:hypothetical protein